MICDKCINSLIKIKNTIMLYNENKLNLDEILVNLGAIIDSISADDMTLYENLNTHYINMEIEYSYSIDNNKYKLNKKIIENELFAIISTINQYAIDLRIDQNIEHKIMGYNINDSISFFIEELNIKPVNIKEIIIEGTDGFRLNEITIVDFVRKHVSALIDSGAKINMYFVYTEDVMNDWMANNFSYNYDKVIFHKQ